MHSDEMRLNSIEERLSRIETRLGISQPSIQPGTLVSPVQTPKPSKSEIESTRETRSGNWLGLIAIICFVLAAGFIIKLSIESGWLTPVRQIGIALIFGFSLILAGLRLINVDKEYTSYLPACGIIIVYLAIYAAHYLYSLIAFDVTMIVFSLISLLCIFLYIRIRNDIYPVIAATGSYLAPFFTALHVDNNTFALYYFLMCSVTFSFISIWVKSRLLTMLSAYLAVGVTAFVGLNLQDNNLVALVLALQFVIFLLGVFFYTWVSKQSLTKKEAWSYFPVLLVFYAAEYYFLSQITQDLAAWLSLAFAAFLFCVYFMTKKIIKTEIASEPMIITFISIVVFHAGYLELLPESAGPWLLAIILFSAAFLPLRFYNMGKSAFFYLPVLLALLAITSIEYLKLICDLYGFNPVSWPALILSVAGIWMLYINKNSLIKNDYGYGLLGASHVMVVLALYDLANPHGSLAVSAAWLIYAIIIIVSAFLRKDKIMANSALFVLFFAAGKALLYDAASAPTIVRILCLLLTGAVLYCAGFLYRQIAKWKM